MSDRTQLVLALCALPPDDPSRRDLYDRLLASAGEARQVDAKFRDFARRKFITSELWQSATLTAKGRGVVEDL